MTTLPRSPARRHAPVIWLLALVLLWQGFSVLRLQTMGGAHTHASSGEPAFAVLSDFRREEAALRVASVGHAHRHADGETQRHHHAAGESGVIVSASEQIVDQAVVDDGSAGASALALLPAALTWAVTTPREAPIVCALDFAAGPAPARLDRPPSIG